VLLSLSLLTSSGSEPVPGEESQLSSARQGALLRLDALAESRRNLPRIPITLSAEPGPQFLLSDKPEYFLNGNGIALQEAVRPGLVRLYLYHVPTPTNGPRTITAALENLGPRTLNLRFLRQASLPPGTDYPRIVKSALLDFFTSTADPTPRQLVSGQSLPLVAALDSASATKDQLVHGFYEFEVDQPARVTVLQRDPAQSTVEALAGLPRLISAPPGKPSGSGAGRGLFPGCNFSVTAPGYVLDTTNGPVQLLLADGRDEPWIRGYDHIDAAEARDVGNYGVLYHVRLTRSSSDGRALALLLGKLGTSSRWCGQLAAVVQISPGIYPGGTVALPGDQTALSHPGEFALVQKFGPLPRGQTETLELTYSPPGAACIPTPFVFLPCAR